MDKEFTNDLMKKLDKCLIENSEEYLNWDWGKIAQEQMIEFAQRNIALYINALLRGFGGFEKYYHLDKDNLCLNSRYDRILFDLLYSFALKQDTDAIEILLFYLGVRYRGGFAAAALGKLKEKKAAPIICTHLREDLTYYPDLITYIDKDDGITLSQYVYMIEALKDIGDTTQDVLSVLEDYSNKAKDASIRREAKKALEGLKIIDS
ncbi:MAG: HEAT repeat domain-containing protein [Candidatus Humimicrobiaceae bacterium]